MSRHAESKLQSHCVAWFRLQYPAFRRLLFAIPNGAFLQGDAKQRAMRWAILEREGANKGTADLFLAVPRKGYPGLFIETKTPNGRQSEEQKAFQKAVEAEGYLYIIPRTLEGFQAVVNEYLKKGIKTGTGEVPVLTPEQIADNIAPALVDCEWHDEQGNPTGQTDWRSWLVEQIEKYANINFT